MSMIFKETLSFALYNLSTLMRRRSGTFSLHDATDQDFLPEGSTFSFHEGSDWFNTSYEDTRPFGEDSILTALLLINGYLFFLHLTRELWEKAIRELYRYGVTGCVPAGHCAEPHDNHTHTVAVARSLCGGERSEAKTALSISTHTG